ncbi:DUF2868 domain-containing protein [Achromobacter sp. F4_2707]|uniref:DUF2868 domain-containing protein n=1 Tax=Achromobacter sp. F4_2707 TaxID=3114286 RepID=UPI0039C6F6FF
MPEAQRGSMTYTFNDHWITETLRLRESLWGPLEDSSETGRARAHGGNFDNRLLTRSRLLAQREGLNDTLNHWRMMARLTLLLFAAVAFLIGCGAAAGALGRGGAVNLAPAVVALLGLNTVAFLLWVASFGMQAGSSASLLSSAWLRLTRKLARGPDAALLPRALLELLARQRLQRWGAGILSHWFWTLALAGALLTLLGMLTTRRYTFQWETTLLSPDTFVALVQGLGWLPSWLGFPQPAADMIRSSSGLDTLPEAAHAVWSVWLIGIVVVYGLLPRIVALILSTLIFRRRSARLAIDPALPGIAELYDRLMPASEAAGIDAPAPCAVVPDIQPAHQAGGTLQYCLMGLELPADLPWPPQTLAPEITDLGVVDTREQRRHVLDALRLQPAQRLLVCCDARQTPDRGTLALLAELASLSHDLQVALLPGGQPAARQEQWQRQLLQAGFSPENIQIDTAAGLLWLAAHSPAGGQASTRHDS